MKILIHFTVTSSYCGKYDNERRLYVLILIRVEMTRESPTLSSLMLFATVHRKIRSRLRFFLADILAYCVSCRFLQLFV